MKIILEDIWYNGVHYDSIEINRDDIDNDTNEQTLVEVIVDYFNKCKHSKD